MMSRIVKARRAVLNLEVEEPRCRFAKALIPSSMPAPGDAGFTIRLPARVRARVVSSNVSRFFVSPPGSLVSTLLRVPIHVTQETTQAQPCSDAGGLPTFILWPTIRSPISCQGLGKGLPL